MCRLRVRYVMTARELNRLDSVAKSPVFSTFDQTLKVT